MENIKCDVCGEIGEIHARASMPGKWFCRKHFEWPESELLSHLPVDSNAMRGETVAYQRYIESQRVAPDGRHREFINKPIAYRT